MEGHYLFIESSSLDKHMKSSIYFMRKKYETKMNVSLDNANLVCR